MRVRESKGDECDMTLKNNIEGIIIKWAYQSDEVKPDKTDRQTVLKTPIFSGFKQRLSGAVECGGQVSWSHGGDPLLGGQVHELGVPL